MSFTTLTIDMPVYLNYLLSRFLSRGGSIHRAAIQHISQAAEGAFCRAPDALVVCAGLSARTLGGVEDKDMYPIRGQTVLLRAPWVRFGRTQSSLDGLWTYIIPRRSGDVSQTFACPHSGRFITPRHIGHYRWNKSRQRLVGAIHSKPFPLLSLSPSRYPNPRPETTDDILHRALKLCPELAPLLPAADGQSSPAPNSNPTVADLKPLVIEAGCGLRPARKGGIRLEAAVVETIKGTKVPVVYNYG